MKHIILSFLLIVSLSINAQVYKQSLKGYWESGFWKKPLKNRADSTGKYVVQYPNGSTRWEGEYEKGKPTGTWKHYYKNGQLSTEVNYNGEYKYWLKNKCLSRIGSYKNGKRTGVWKEYYYQNYKSCDSIIYSSEYSFSTKTETWYGYQSPGSEEKEFLDPYYFNKDLNSYYHRFTDINYGVFNIDLSLLNRSIFSSNSGINNAQKMVAISQSLIAQRITRRDIRLEYRAVLPQTFVENNNEYSLSAQQVLLSLGGDLINRDAIDIYPFIGFGAGSLQLDYVNTDLQINETYERFAGQVNLMLENRINLKPYIAKWGFSLGFKAGCILEAGGTNWRGNEQALDLTTNKLAGYYILGVFGLYY